MEEIRIGTLMRSVMKLVRWHNAIIDMLANEDVTVGGGKAHQALAYRSGQCIEIMILAKECGFDPKRTNDGKIIL